MNRITAWLALCVAVWAAIALFGAAQAHVTPAPAESE